RLPGRRPLRGPHLEGRAEGLRRLVERLVVRGAHRAVQPQEDVLEPHVQAGRHPHLQLGVHGAGAHAAGGCRVHHAVYPGDLLLVDPLVLLGAEHRHREVLEGGAGALEGTLVDVAGVHAALPDAPAHLGPGQLHDDVGDAPEPADRVDGVSEPGRRGSVGRGGAVGGRTGDHLVLLLWSACGNADGVGDVTAGVAGGPALPASSAESSSHRSPSRLRPTTMRLASTRPSGTVTLLISWSRKTRTTAESSATLSTAERTTVPVEAPSPLLSSSRRPSET